MKLKLIVAMCSNMGIGYNNNIPWHIKKDLIHFSNKTTGIYGKYLKDIQKYHNENDENNNYKEMQKYRYKIIKKNAIVMGKNTWMSLPKYPDPLPNRDNIIISNTIQTSSSNYDNRLLNMNNNETLPMIKVFYDMIYYIEKEDLFKIKKGIDFIMYFSSISSMIDSCMTSYKICDNSYAKNTSNHTKIEMAEMSEAREINHKSCFKKINEKFEILNKISDTTIYDEVWIIGGAKIYNSFISENNKKDSNMLISEFCITYIDKYYECDTFFPKIENMNMYYISYFLKCENMDYNTGIIIPVYYITFTLIDLENSVDVEKRIVKIKYDNDLYDSKQYYYYIKTNMELECKNMFISDENAISFLWCITEL